MQFSIYAAEAYSESFQTSKTELFAKKINGFQLLTSLAKGYTSDVLQGSEYTFTPVNHKYKQTINDKDKPQKNFKAS